jgi:Hemolysin coregulated protein Hcp (TssD)
MSFKAKFIVGGKEYNVKNVSYSLHQEVDSTGRPSSITQDGKITVTVESTGGSEFFEWMTDNFDRKDGSVKYIKRDTDATMKELKFTEGYMVEYKEAFDSTGTNPLTETFTISAKKIEMGNGAHVNEWV